jgi:hypothetical protein
VREELAVTLEVAPDMPKESSKAMRVAGWTGLAGGLAALAAGIPLIIIDEREIAADCNADVEGNCQWRYDTLGGGIALTAVGGALAITGITLLAIDKRRRASPTAWLQPFPSGLAIAGRF